MILSWLGFLGVLAKEYVLANAGFALLYLIDTDNIANARANAGSSHFWDAFFGV
ncbi:MAG: hypothetical protein ACUVRV_08295 [Cyanobacteriota bacterium]